MSLNICINCEATDKMHILVVDMDGRVVMLKTEREKQSQKWHDQIYVSGFASGLYFIHVFVGQERFTSKFVKIGR